MLKRLVAGLALGTALLSHAAAAQEDWYPSKYGADDTIGALNTLSPEKAVAAASLVKTGKVYALGGVTGRSTPAFGHRSFNMILYPHGDGTGAPGGSNKATGNDDYLATWVGIGTQIDGFAHMGIDHTYYNGKNVSEIFNPHGAQVYGTHAIPPIATRGVLLDMTKVFGKDTLEPGTAFNKAEIDRAMSAAGVEIGEGDVVLFHTGWQALADSDPQRFLSGEPGLGKEGAAYLAELGVAAVGSDTWGVEVVPFEEQTEIFPVHQELLARNGVHLLENIQTAELAADGATEFLFVLGVPRFEGAVQMVINPVAIR